MRPGDATLEPQSKDKGILVRIGELIVGWCCVALDRVSVFVCLCCVSVALLNETDRFPKTPEDGMGAGWGGGLKYLKEKIQN